MIFNTGSRSIGIRPSLKADSPGGIPDVLYFTPQTTGSSFMSMSCKMRYKTIFVLFKRDSMTASSSTGRSGTLYCVHFPQAPPAPQEFCDLAGHVMQEAGRLMPTDAERAVDQYDELTDSVDRCIGQELELGWVVLFMSTCTISNSGLRTCL